MQRLFILGMAAGLAVTTGCGQKGPLTLPKPELKAPAQESPPPTPAKKTP